MISLILRAVLLGVPGAYELDFAVLAPEPRGIYEYTIVLSFKGEPDVRIPTTVARKYGPDGAASLLMDCLDDPRWKLKRNASRITISGYDDVRIQNLKVEGEGPKPLVRRILLPPAKK